MTTALSANTQAILLLTAPLIVGRSSSNKDLLKPGEYKRLAHHLLENQQQPADLITSHSDEILSTCKSVFDMERLQRLLGRGFLLSQALERWQTRAIWVVSRADAEYPQRLKMLLKGDAPAVLYGCGDRRLLNAGGLAVVGSRHVSDALIRYTEEIGRLAAQAGRNVVSGGAKGVDQAAMRGCLQAGGQVCGILADSLERHAMNREYRNALLDGQLALISPYDPNAGFNVGNAMQRNKLIYALGDGSLVINSDVKGGTWSGAIEQLEKLKFTQVYVRSVGEHSPGLEALRMKGALDWPNPTDAASLDEALKRVPLMQTRLSFNAEKETNNCQQPSIDFGAHNPGNSNIIAVSAENAIIEVEPNSTPDTYELNQDYDPELTAAENLFAVARIAIKRLVGSPMKETEVAERLNISKTQAKLWLDRLVDDGVLEKRKSPAGYVVKADLLL